MKKIVVVFLLGLLLYGFYGLVKRDASHVGASQNHMVYLPQVNNDFPVSLRGVYMEQDDFNQSRGSSVFVDKYGNRAAQGNYVPYSRGGSVTSWTSPSGNVYAVSSWNGGVMVTSPRRVNWVLPEGASSGSIVAVADSYIVINNYLSSVGTQYLLVVPIQEGNNGSVAGGTPIHVPAGNAQSSSSHYYDEFLLQTNGEWVMTYLQEVNYPINRMTECIRVGKVADFLNGSARKVFCNSTDIPVGPPVGPRPQSSPAFAASAISEDGRMAIYAMEGQCQILDLSNQTVVYRDSGYCDWGSMAIGPVAAGYVAVYSVNGGVQRTWSNLNNPPRLDHCGSPFIQGGGLYSSRYQNGALQVCVRSLETGKEIGFSLDGFYSSPFVPAD